MKYGLMVVLLMVACGDDGKTTLAPDMDDTDMGDTFEDIGSGPDVDVDQAERKTEPWTKSELTIDGESADRPSHVLVTEDTTFFIVRGRLYTNDAGELREVGITGEPTVDFAHYGDRVLTVTSERASTVTDPIEVGEARILKMDATIDLIFPIEVPQLFTQSPGAELKSSTVVGNEVAISGLFTAAGQDSHGFIGVYSAEGTPKPSFGDEGFAFVAIPGSDVDFRQVASAPNGTLYAGGLATWVPIVAKFTASGTLDPSFGEDGIVSLDAFEFSEPKVLATDDAIFVAVDTSVLGFDLTGRPLPGFGTNGVATVAAEGEVTSLFEVNEVIVAVGVDDAKAFWSVVEKEGDFDRENLRVLPAETALGFVDASSYGGKVTVIFCHVVDLLCTDEGLVAEANVAEFLTR